MASPQIENGHTDIANELLEALCRIRIPGEARQVLDTIIRKTYGWHKKEDVISLSQFVRATGMNKPHIVESLSKLLRMNIITEKGKAVTEKGDEIGRIYGPNKDYETWRPLPKKVTLPKKIKTLTEKDKGALPKKGPTKEISKETKARYAASFEIFWNDYPARDGRKVGKAVALHYYCLLREDELPCATRPPGTSRNRNRRGTVLPPIPRGF